MQWVCAVRACLAASIAAALAGCSSLIPTSGPLSEEITRDVSINNSGDYLVVEINGDVVRRLSSFKTVGLASRFAPTRTRASLRKIGKGDTLSVTVWEAGEGGLFSSKETKNITIPALSVDQKGFISLPYAGLIEVADRTPIEVEKRIVSNLEGRAIHPQVTVQIVKNESQTVVLSGDVNQPGRLPLSSQGDRLVDVLAAAGGTKYRAEEVYVTFVRGNERGSQLLRTILEDQRENIVVEAGDRINLSYEPRRYSVFGAAEKPGIFPIEGSGINLLEAVAGAGGLNDSRADATGIFVFRYEPPSVARSVHGDFDASRFGTYIPVVYKINLRDPSAYFYARGFTIQNNDVLYVANAKGVEFTKIFKFLNVVSSTVGIGRRVND